MNTATLIDGRQVDSASEEWRLETEARELLNRNTIDRREYLDAVERKRGRQACEALKATFLKLWEARKK